MSTCGVFLVCVEVEPNGVMSSAVIYLTTLFCQKLTTAQEMLESADGRE